VGADGEILPPDKVAVVAVPKPAEPAPGPEASGDVAIAAVPKPSPSPIPSPSPTPRVTPTPIQSVTPKPQVSSPVVQAPAKPPVRQIPGATPGPRSTAEPKVPVTPTPIPGSTPTPIPTATSTTQLPDRPPETPPPVLSNVGSLATLSGIQPLPCAVGKVCTVEDNPQLRPRDPKNPEAWKIVPLSKLPPGTFPIKVVAAFDGSSGWLSNNQRIIVPPVAGWTPDQQEELEGVVGSFLRGCAFVFVPRHSAANQPLVELTIDLTIEVK
jgi:hypothetical protein